jgi:hypothetical protein
VETLYKAYKDKAQFFLVYIREAHPSPEKGQADEQRAKEQLKRFGDKGITQPRTMDERLIAADKCMKDLKLTIPILLDSIEGDYLKAYGGFQAGTVVIDIDGKIAYWTRGAPNGAKPAEAEAALKKLLSAGGGAITEKWADVKMPAEKPAEQPAKDENKPAATQKEKTK